MAIRAVAKQQEPISVTTFFPQVSRFMGEFQSGPVKGVPPQIQEQIQSLEKSLAEAYAQSQQAATEQAAPAAVSHAAHIMGCIIDGG